MGILDKLAGMFGGSQPQGGAGNPLVHHILTMISDPSTGGLQGLVQSFHDKGLGARFRCVLALVDPFTGGGEPLQAEGVCEGTITRTPRGSGGFGYDPLFVVEERDKTMAELTDDEKNQVSHRARALATMRPLIERALEERRAQVARVS